MPIRNGNLTPQERIFAERMAATGDARYAAEKAGYAHPIQRASQNLGKPAVSAEIQAQQLARLHNIAVPLAYDLLIEQMQDSELAPQHRQGAAKIVLNAAKGYLDPSTGKTLDDMDLGEVGAALAKVRAEIKARATTLEPVDVMA
jgi:phage terminase small subunit